MKFCPKCGNLMVPTRRNGRTILKCRVCGYEWSFDVGRLSEDVREALHFIPEVIHSYTKCPRCGSILLPYLDLEDPRNDLYYCPVCNVVIVGDKEEVVF